ncbi:hypothetical protein R1flu_014350 [Riccia fluitans]|uniref:Uncharacterized protein n=1 Tax=Riccia fluitans TaxID=41844 RepID=A0ABD1YJ88_9MARC
MVAARSMIVGTAILSARAVVVVTAMVAVGDMIVAFRAVLGVMAMDREPQSIAIKGYIKGIKGYKLFAIMATAIRSILAEEHGTPQQSGTARRSTRGVPAIDPPLGRSTSPRMMIPVCLLLCLLRQDILRPNHMSPYLWFSDIFVPWYMLSLALRHT